MQTEIIISGFGGQGAMFTGQLLAYTGMYLGKEVTWLPSYGPEMRGGTANCTVIISDEEIGSPLVRNPKAAIVMNLPSLNKYENVVAKGGVLVINSSMVDRKCQRDDIIALHIPANQIAETIRDKKMTNMVLLGGLLAAMPVLPLDAVEKTLADHTADRHKRFLSLNIEALHQGAEFARQATQPAAR